MLSVKAIFAVLLLGSSLCRQARLSTGLETTHKLSPLAKAEAAVLASPKMTPAAMEFIGVKPVPEIYFQNFMTAILTSTNPLIKEAVNLGLDNLPLIHNIEVYMDLSPEEFTKTLPRMVEQYTKLFPKKDGHYLDQIVQKVIENGPIPIRENWQNNAFEGYYACEYRLRAKESETKKGAFHLGTYLTCVMMDHLHPEGLEYQVLSEAEGVFKAYAYMLEMRDN